MSSSRAGVISDEMIAAGDMSEKLLFPESSDPLNMCTMRNCRASMAMMWRITVVLPTPLVPYNIVNRDK
jgi:hypothetical protein